MIIVSKPKQKLNGLSNNEIVLIDYIRLLSQIKVPNGTNSLNAMQFRPRLMYYDGVESGYGNYLKVHHKMFNKHYSLSILLRVNSFLLRNNDMTTSNCWVFNNNYSEIKFAFKEGMYQDYTLHDDIGSVDSFLIRHEFYPRLIANIEKDLFNIA